MGYPLSILKPPRLHLSRSQLNAIGLFAARWAYFETEMDFTISALRALQKEIKAAPGGFDDRVKYWKRLARKQYKNHPALKAYLRIIKDVEEGQKRRATILHGRSLGDPKKHTTKIAFDHHRHKPGTWTSKLWKFSPRRIVEMATYLGRLATWLRELNKVNLGREDVAPTALPHKYPRSPDGDKSRRPRNPNNGSPRPIRLKSSSL